MAQTASTSQIARTIRDLCMARPDLLRPDGLPSTAAIARATQTQKYRLSQPTVSRVLRGEIVDPTTSVVRAFAELFRVSERTIRGDVEFGVDVGRTAMALAQRFAQLPEEAQQYLLSQVDLMLGFQDASPRLAGRALGGREKEKTEQ